MNATCHLRDRRRLAVSFTTFAHETNAKRMLPELGVGSRACLPTRPSTHGVLFEPQTDGAPARTTFLGDDTS
jgi:hypothetical protein